MGGAGSLCPELRIGNVFIPTWGIREEGTSYHYAPPELVPKPSVRLVSALEEELMKEGVRRVVIRWCLDY